MSVESPAFANQGATYPAEQTRRALGTLLARGGSIGSILGGLVSSTDCQITAAAGMNIAIGPGEAWVPGSSAATQSGYYARVSSSSTLAIATSDPSNPRIDRVSAIVKDKAYAGTEDAFAVAVTTGTPTSGATLVNLSGVAAAPASSLTLGYVLVPAASVSTTNGNISNVATLARSAALSPEGAYTALSNVNAEEEILNSTSRLSFVSLYLASKVAFAAAVLVNGVTIAAIEAATSTQAAIPCSFLVPANQKWKYKNNSGTVETARYSKLPL